MEDFYFVYVLHSLKDGKNYAGYTKNLELRFEQHQKGLVTSTKHRRPFELIYFEGCNLNQFDNLFFKNIFIVISSSLSGILVAKMPK